MRFPWRMANRMLRASTPPPRQAWMAFAVGARGAAEDPGMTMPTPGSRTSVKRGFCASFFSSSSRVIYPYLAATMTHCCKAA